MGIDIQCHCNFSGVLGKQIYGHDQKLVVYMYAMVIVWL